MSLTSADIKTPDPDLDALEHLAEHLELARTGRLEELFARMQRSRLPWHPLVAAQECALSLALWSLRADDIEHLADRTLSLFGLRGRAQHPQESWIEAAFKSQFPKVLSSGLSRYHHNIEEALWVPPESLELGRLLLMCVPSFALRDRGSLRPPDGLALTEHLVGEDSYGELRERFPSGWGKLPRPDELALRVCQEVLSAAQRNHGCASLPEAIDRGALASALRAKLEAELTHREAEYCDIPF